MGQALLPRPVMSPSDKPILSPRASAVLFFDSLRNKHGEMIPTEKWTTVIGLLEDELAHEQEAEDERRTEDLRP